MIAEGRTALRRAIKKGFRFDWARDRATMAVSFEARSRAGVEYDVETTISRAGAPTEGLYLEVFRRVWAASGRSTPKPEAQ